MQTWIIIESGGNVLRYTDGPDQHPSECGHAEECENALAVWMLPREPDYAHGEVVDPLSGEILFSLVEAAPSLLSLVKEEASRRILEVSPLWRQLNDMREPEAPGAAEREAQINQIRIWSGNVEQQILSCQSPEEVRQILLTLGES